MPSTHSLSYQPLIIPSQSPVSPSPPSHSRRPSTASTMPNWLSRSPTPGSQVHFLTSKPSKVAEKLVRTIDIVSGARTGALGLGATVVRTPDEALRDTGVRINYAVQNQSTLARSSSEKQHKKDEKPLRSKHKRGPSKQVLLSPPTSPPLPPLPLPEEDEEKLLEGETIIETPRPTRSLPDLHRSLSKRSSLKLPKALSISHSNSSSEEPPSVPPVPAHIAAANQPPPFSPILVSEPSSMIVNRNKVIVTLETCTQTFRTTLPTLTSRPSHLAKFLTSLYCLPTPSSAISSVYSSESEDMALYRQHLTSQGLVPLSSNVHLFLDRPSAPYIHILAYLRQPIVEGQPDTLPHALQLHNYTPSSLSPLLNLQSRLDTLIELRDEAAYLNLEGLYRLCADEIRHRYGPRQLLHQRGNSSSSVPSIHSMQASVYGLQTLPEKVETARDSIPVFFPPMNTPTSAKTAPSTVAATSTSSQAAAVPPGSVIPPTATIAMRRSKHALLGDNTVSRSPPTPQSMEGAVSEQGHSSHSRSSSRSRPTVTPPAGWI